MQFSLPDLDDPDAHPKAVRQALARQRQAVQQAYAEHNARIRPLLPPPLQQLQDTDLHDGRFYALQIDYTRRTVRFDLLCGDTHQGLFDLCLLYHDIELTQRDIDLLCLIAHEPSAQISWTEIDIADDSPACRFLHRILWNTGIRTGFTPCSEGSEQGIAYTLTPEIELRFGGLAITLTPRTDGGNSNAPCVLTIARDPGFVAGKGIPD